MNEKNKSHLSQKKSKTKKDKIKIDRTEICRVNKLLTIYLPQINTDFQAAYRRLSAFVCG
jgi:hypothetical protein